MKTKNKIFIKFSVQLFVSFLIGVSTIIIVSGNASAAPGEASNFLGHQIVSYVNASCEADPLGTCPGSYHSKFSLAYLYIPTSTGSASVMIDGMDLANHSGGLEAFSVMHLLNNDSCEASPVAASYTNSITNGTTLSFPNSYNGSHKLITNQSTGTQYVVYCVSVSTGPTRPYPRRENVGYNLTSSGGTYLGVFSGPSTSLGTGYFGGNGLSYNPPNNTNWWNEVVAFSPPCGPGGVGGSITMYDLDTYAAASSSMQIYVAKTLKPGVNSPDGGVYGQVYNIGLSGDVTQLGGNVYDVNTGPTGSTWTVNPSGEPWYPEYVYSVHLNNIGSANKVRIRLPYDQINSVFSCGAPDQQPSLSVAPECANARIRVASTDPDGNNYNIQYWVNGGGPYFVGRSGDGYFYINMGGNGRYSAVTVRVYTEGTRPPNATNLQSNDTGNFTFGPCYRQIQGTIYNAYNKNQRYAGVTINTCISGVSATTDGNGWFSFDVLTGSGFCVRVSGNPAGSVATNVRPWAEGYAGCAGYGWGVASPDYCGSYSTYECQIAGAHGWPGCGSGNMDRASDTGFDFVLRYRPTISCAITSSTSMFQVGLAYTPTVRVTNTGGSTRPPVSGTATVSFTSRSDEGRSYGPLNAGGVADLTYTTFTITTPGTYTLSARATGTGDGISIDPSPVNCTGGGNIPIGVYPYMKEYGGDVWSGGNFLPESCAGGSSGNIFAHNMPSDTSATGGQRYSGSSAQFTVTALLTINQFNSVSNRDPIGAGSNTYPPKGLTFANTGGGTPSGTYGGGFGSAAGQCITDFFDETRVSSSTDFINVDTDPTAFPPANTTINPDPPEPQKMFAWTSAGGVDDSTPPVMEDYPYCFRFDASSTDPHTWNDNWLCSRYPMNNLRWYIRPTSSTPFPAPFWFQIYEPGDDYINTQWDRRYFMIADSNPGLNLAWINNSATDPSIPYGQPGARGCTRISEFVAGENPTWGDNWLCANWVLLPDLGDNVATTATSVTSSSQHTAIPGSTYLDDYARDGRSGSAVTSSGNTGEWATQGEGAGAWIRFNLASASNIAKVQLYDRPNPTDRVLSGEIRFSSGTAVPFRQLSNNGALPLSITFPTRNNVTWVEIRVNTSTGPNIGLAEVNIFEEQRPITVSGNFPAGRTQYHMLANTNKTINVPVTIPINRQVAVFVNGNVYIRENITFETGYSNISEMPYFALIVCGNIYIDGNVTRLDGLYVAQPGTYQGGQCVRNGATPATSGTIYTCATAATTPCTASNVYAQGQNQLSVNGSLVANRIKFLRIRQTVLGSPSIQVPNFNSGAGTGAGEVINYNPQMYLAPSPLKKPGDTDGGEGTEGSISPYDSIRSLPPVF